MARVEDPVALESYRSSVEAPDDFDAFWSARLGEARADARPVSITAVDGPLTEIETFDVEFSGFGGHRIKAWYLRPRHRPGPLPTLVRFSGYGRGRTRPHEHLVQVAAGYGHVVMDTRGQGGPYAAGSTPDPVGSAPCSTGFTTRGIHDPADYYYTRVIVDAVRLVEEVSREFEPTFLGLIGNSQGGGLAVAASGLSTAHDALLAAHPFLVDIPRGLAISSCDPYDEIVRFLRVNPDAVAAAIRTLSYVDGINFARRSKVPALFATGLMDPVCPPSTAFALRAAYAGECSLSVFPFGDHDCGGAAHIVEQLNWLDGLTAVR